MSKTTHPPHTVGVNSPRANDLKEVAKVLFPQLPTAKRYEAMSRLLGFGSAAAFQAKVKAHVPGLRFELPVDRPIVDDVLRSAVGEKADDDGALEALVLQALSALEPIGYMFISGLMPTLMPFSMVEKNLFEERPNLYEFNAMIYSDIEMALFYGHCSFTEQAFSEELGRGICDRLWIGGQDGDGTGSWAHPLLQAGLRRAIRNPDIVEWIVEKSVRSNWATGQVRCERETPGFTPLGVRENLGIEERLQETMPMVRPYLASMNEWLHLVSPKWRAPEQARSLLQSTGSGSMSMTSARELVEGLQAHHDLDPVMMAQLAGLSQCVMPLDPRGDLPIPDFCLAAGLGLLANPASVDRPTPAQLEKAIRSAADDMNLWEADDQLVMQPEVVDVLAREIAVSRERGVQALHTRIEMSVGG